MARVDQSLGMFQSGLLCVEREMLPIYKLTEKLRATQKNIDLCVLELRKIHANFVAAHEASALSLGRSVNVSAARTRALVTDSLWLSHSLAD